MEDVATVGTLSEDAHDVAALAKGGSGLHHVCLAYLAAVNLRVECRGDTVDAQGSGAVNDHRPRGLRRRLEAGERQPCELGRYRKCKDFLCGQRRALPGKYEISSVPIVIGYIGQREARVLRSDGEEGRLCGLEPRALGEDLVDDFARAGVERLDRDAQFAEYGRVDRGSACASVEVDENPAPDAGNALGNRLGRRSGVGRTVGNFGDERTIGCGGACFV